MKAIETEYKGYKFRSRLEARWAVFFDACGVKWEYEPEGFDLGDGLYYLPDFLLHDVLFRNGKTLCDLWVEVKGVMSEADARKIGKFANEQVDPTWGYFNGLENPILVVTDIPSGDGIDEIITCMRDLSYGNSRGGVAPYNFYLIDGDQFGAFPVINKQGRFVIMDDNGRCSSSDIEWQFDDKATENAYKLARQARFEHGAKPQISESPTLVDLMTAPNETNIDILSVKGATHKFVKAARLYTAITGLDASISRRHPIIKAADGIGAKYYRFETKRLSGGGSYGRQAYYFAVDDVPKILGQYVEHHHCSKNKQQIRYNLTAKELRKWFNNAVLPRYNKRVNANEQSIFSRQLNP